MKLGIFGSFDDPQSQALTETLNQMGVDVFLVDSQGLNEGVDAAFDGKRFLYKGEPLDEIKCWYLRHIMSPIPPGFELGDKYYLYSDWFVDYMQRKERFGFQLSWLLALSIQGIPVINPPEHGGVVQLKPFQLQMANLAGLKIPKTLITNNPQRVRSFLQEVDEVIYKPLLGGAICQALDEEALSRLETIVASPVIFQERAHGRSVRLTIIGQEVVSAVAIPSQNLDYRSDPVYTAGEQHYETVDIPPPLIDGCLKLMKHCGLLFSGIDFILSDDGSFTFLEANSSPIYLDIEEKTKNPITLKLAELMLKLANEPEWYRETVKEALRHQNFLRYALPFDPSRTTHDS